MVPTFGMLRNAQGWVTFCVLNHNTHTDETEGIDDNMEFIPGSIQRP